jgi:hypothetical protein
MVRSILPPSEAGRFHRTTRRDDSLVQPIVVSPHNQELCAPRPQRVGSGVSDIIKRFNESSSGSDNGVVGLATNTSPPPWRGEVAGEIVVAKASIVTPDAAASRVRKNPAALSAMPSSYLVPETNPPRSLKPRCDKTKSIERSTCKHHDGSSPSVVSPNQECRTPCVPSADSAKIARNRNRISGMIAAFEHTRSVNVSVSPPAQVRVIPGSTVTQRRQNELVRSNRTESAGVDAEPHVNGPSPGGTVAAVIENAPRQEHSSTELHGSPTAARMCYESSSKDHVDASPPTIRVESSLVGFDSNVRRPLSSDPVHDDDGLKALALANSVNPGHHSAGASVRVAEFPFVASPYRVSSTGAQPNFGDLSPIKDSNEGVTGKSSLSTEMEVKRDGLVSKIGPSQSTHFKLSETRHSSNSSSFQSRLLQFSKSIAKFSDTMDARPSLKEVDGKVGVLLSSEPMEETTESSYSVNEDSQGMANDLSAGDVGKLDDWRVEDPAPLASLCDVSSEAPTSPQKDPDVSLHSTAVSPSKVKILRSKFDVAIASAASASTKAEISQEGFEVAANILEEESSVHGQKEYLTVGANVLEKERDRAHRGQSTSAFDIEEKRRSAAVPRRPLTLSLQSRKPSTGDGPPSAPGSANQRSNSAASTDAIPNSIAPADGPELDAEAQFEPPKPIRMMPKQGIMTLNGWDFLSPHEDAQAMPKPSPSTYKLAPNPKDTGVSSKSRKLRGPSCDDSQGACPVYIPVERASLVADEFSFIVPTGAQSSADFPEDVADGLTEDVSSGSNIAKLRAGAVDLDITVEDSMEVDKSVELPATFDRSTAVDLDITVEDSTEVEKSVEPPVSFDRSPDSRAVETVLADLTDSRGVDEVTRPDSRLLKLPPNPKDTKRTTRSSKSGRYSSMSDGGLVKDADSLGHSPRLERLLPPSPRTQITPPASRNQRSLSQTNPIWTAMDGSERVKRWRKFRRRQNDDLESSVDDFDCSASDRENPPDEISPETSAASHAALRWDPGDPPESRPRSVGTSAGTKTLRRSPRSTSSASVMIEI